jgi:subtilase family serine protease
LESELRHVRRMKSSLHHLVDSFHSWHPLISRLIVCGLVTASFSSITSASGATTVAGHAFSPLATAHQVGQGYTPAQLETAYGIDPLFKSGLTGAGQTIALVELDSFDPTDIQAFDAQNNLPDAVIQETYVGGKTFRLTNQGETTMDLEWAHALAPGAKIRVYYIKGQQANAAGWQAVGQAVNSAVAAGATSISLSFGTCNPSTGYQATSTALSSALAHGISVFVSSGDTGDLAGPVRECGRQPSVGYPASDPSVVAVGGTSLLLNDDNTQYSQFAWSLSGGGKAKPMLRPTWQLTPNLKPGKFRYAPDVSFLANPATGAEIFYNGDWQTAGGTSLGAPAWAAIWTLVKADATRQGKTVGAAPTYLYKIGNSSAYSNAFTDITSGSNGAYGAKTGWDAVTGWGTPLVSGLAAAVTSIAS